MTQDFEVGPDLANVVQDWLAHAFTGIEDALLLDKNIGSRLPSTGLSGRMPFVRVNVFGGDDTRMNLYPTFDLETFAATYAVASDLARRIEAKLIGYPFSVSSGGRTVLVDRVEVLSPAVEVEWQQDSTIRRFQGTYQFSIRRR